MVKHVTALAGAFRQRGLPVILVNVFGAAPGRTEQPSDHRELSLGWTEFIPELNQRPQDLVRRFSVISFPALAICRRDREMSDELN